MYLRCIVISGLLAALVQHGAIEGQEFFDDFEDGNFLDRDPVQWTALNGNFAVDGGDLVVANKGSLGAVATVNAEVFEGRAALRALVTFRDLDEDPEEADVFLIANFGPSITGYLGELWWNGRLVIGRAPGGGFCCNVLAETTLADFDPEADWWIELEVETNSLALRAWSVCEPRSAAPQITALDPSPFTSGVTGLGFRRLPPSGTSKGVLREFAASNSTLTDARPAGCPTEPRFRRGDCDADGEINITDGIVLLLYLFSGGEAPGCLAACDANRAGGLDITTAIYIFNWLFLGGPEPSAPFTECGERTAGDLSCEADACAAG